MPLAVLTSHSTLLTASGWVDTSVPRVIAAIGVDRHGRLSISDVEVSISGESIAECFLGTRAAFGAFHADTVLIDATGGRRSVASMCEAEEIQGIKCESCVHGADLMHPQSGFDRLWDALSAAALVGNRETLVVKSSADGLGGKDRLIHLSRLQLEREFATSGFVGASKRLASLLQTTDGMASVDRRAYQLALWLATCRKASGEGYRFEFDSIQHSCTVNVELDAYVGLVEPLRTAFSAGVTNPAIIKWTDRSWSPVSSGFILGGRTQ
jgi:hypothetical protein